MGSLNSDGSRKTSVNKMGRNLGGRTVFSQNRTELSSVKNPSAVESSNNLATESKTPLSESTINLGGRLKVVDDNGEGSTITEGGIADLTNPNPPLIIPGAEPIVMVKVGRSNAQSIANSTGNIYVSWDTEIIDDLGISPIGEGANVKVCTFTEAGIWDAKAVGYWDVCTAGALYFGIQLYSSADALKVDAISSIPGAITVAARSLSCATLVVAPGDYVKVYVYQDKNGGAPLNLGASVGVLNCTLFRIE